MSSSLMILKESLRANVFESRQLRAAEDGAWLSARDLRDRLNFREAVAGDEKMSKHNAGQVEVGGFEATQKWAGDDEINPDWISEHDATRWNLHQRRTVELRRQARWKNLAWGFLTGTPYKEMEDYSYEPPSWHISIGRAERMRQSGEIFVDPVKDYILKHSPLPEQTVLQQYSEWIAAANEQWMHPDLGPRQKAAAKRDAAVRKMLEGAH